LNTLPVEGLFVSPDCIQGKTVKLEPLPSAFMWNDPLIFEPIYQQRPWGGRMMQSLLGRELPLDGARYGESWEICDREKEQSYTRLADGQRMSLHDLWTSRREEVFGKALLNHPASRFPLLLKILDASEVLSIQVHPPQSVAEALGSESKTEMWYVAAANPGAKIYAGLCRGVQRDDFEQAIQEGTVAECVQELTPIVGDTLFIPSGMIHAIGAGLLIYELQQNSDTTYRVFDWNRIMPDGKPRELHIAQSMQSIDFSMTAPALLPACEDQPTIRCDTFEVWQRSELRGSQLREGQGKNLMITVISGVLELEAQSWTAGTTALVPAAMTQERRQAFHVKPGTRWLEMQIPEKTV